MKGKICRRLAAAAVSFVFFGAAFWLNWNLGQHGAQASEPDRTVNIGSSQLAAPAQPEEGKAWSGDYVYYGSYEGEPMKWRVLDPSGQGGGSSANGGILLQSDRVIVNMPFEDGEAEAGGRPGDSSAVNRWQTSDVRQWLQRNDRFLSNGNFSSAEKAGIMKTSGAAGESPSDVLKSERLNRDTVFLLDAADLANHTYGYSCDEGNTNSGIKGPWWLRSPHARYDVGIGCVLSGGYLYYDFVYENGGVVPAFNLNPSKILFMTDAGDKKEHGLEAVQVSEINEWRLTLSEGGTLKAGDGIARSGNQVSIPYTYSGTDANQISLMITSGEYENGNTVVKYYGKVSGEKFEAAGSVSVLLPDDFDEENDIVYLLAEQVCGEKRTDYASEPVKLELPPPHIHEFVWKFDEDAHWQECVAPGCDLEGDEARINYEEHDFGENEGVVIKEPTAEEDGVEEILCDICGNMIPQPLPFEEPDEDDPDEEEPGEEEPGEDEPDEEDHEWAEEIIKPATCTEAGVKRVFCTDDECGVSREEVIPALSATLTHTFGEWVQVTAPTTEQEGLSRRVCSVCAAEEKQAIPKLKPSHTHNYEYIDSDDSHHWSLCACGDKGDVEPHEWDAGKVLKKPTKKQAGEIQYQCEICDRTMRRAVEKTGTRFSSGMYQYRVTACKNGKPTAALLGFAKGKTTKLVSIPKTATCKGVKYAVTAVADKAFASNEKIQRVVIGDNVETIGNFAFFLAENVESILVGTGVKEFGEHVFCHTYKLKTLVVKSKKLTEASTGLLHGGMKVTVKVPKKKVKQYQEKVFFTHSDSVRAIEE